MVYGRVTTLSKFALWGKTNSKDCVVNTGYCRYLVCGVDDVVASGEGEQGIYT